MAHVESGHLNGGDVDVYVCGPPPMVDALRAWFGEQSVTTANFYYEKFLPSSGQHGWWKTWAFAAPDSGYQVKVGK